MKMEASSSYEALVPVYQSTQYQVSEHWNLHQDRCYKLKVLSYLLPPPPPKKKNIMKDQNSMQIRIT